MDEANPTLQNNLQRAMDDAAKTIGEASKPLPTLSDPEKLMAAAERLLRGQQGKLANDRALYEAERTERTNYYRAEMAKLSDEAESEMLMLRKKWDKDEAIIIRTIDVLKALLSA